MRKPIPSIDAWLQEAKAHERNKAMGRKGTVKKEH